MFLLGTVRQVSDIRRTRSPVHTELEDEGARNRVEDRINNLEITSIASSTAGVAFSSSHHHHHHYHHHTAGAGTRLYVISPRDLLSLCLVSIDQEQ